MDRDILHVYIPHFPITLARAADPALRGRPVVVVPGHSERAPVRHLSAEARSEGIFEGMPLFRARRLCPSLVALSPDPRRLSCGTHALVRLTREYTPLWEPASAGRVYLDITGSRRLLGPGRDAALRLERELERRLNLPGAVGVAGNKLVSRIAAGAIGKPGICDVPRGDEARFIAPFPATVLPGVGRAREQVLLGDLNLRRVGQVAALTLPQLTLPFGPFAHLLYQRARGVDPSPVVPPRRTPSVGEECHLDRFENDDRLLLAELYRLAEGCGFRLRRMAKEAARLKLTVHYADGFSASRTRPVAPPSAGDLPLFQAAHVLYLQACGRRVQVRGMELTCDRIEESRHQMELFRADRRPEAALLQETLDKVRERYGKGAVAWGRTAVDVNPKPKIQNPKMDRN